MITDRKMEKEVQQKYDALKSGISGLGNAVVAFSGGIDSTLVLKIAFDVLKENAVAVTADSPSLPRNELEEAKKIAREIGARHAVILTKETRDENYLKNPGNRCYYCKTELYSKLKKFAAENNFTNILNGTNKDDMKDYRPGMMAAEQHKIISPLKDAGVSKDEVRIIAKSLKLKAWDKPSSPCLSSRVPYNQKITMEKLRMVEDSEKFLKDLGIRELRVRHFGNSARIEVKNEDKKLVGDNFPEITKKFNEIGFKEILVSDFKSGSLNVMINVHAEH